MKFDTLTSTLEEKKGLWDNMHARRKAGKPKRKPGDKNYPKTLNVEETCGKGEYFCNDDQKCKPIPEGTKVKSNGELVSEGEAWTRKEGQNKEGGLNEKGRKSYERANPGSDLKAPSKKKGNKRRASFCARMKGMRKRQKPSNNTGEDRLSKSLRAWNCSYEWELDLLEDAKMGKQSDDKLAAAHKKFSGMDQSSPANKFMLKRISKEMDRRKKVNEHHQKDEDGKVIEHEDTPDMEVINPKQPWDKLEEAKVDMKTPDYKRATVRDKRYGNPHGSHELGGGIRKDRRADHEAKRGVKTKGNNPVKDESVRQRRSPGLQLSSFSIIEKLKMTRKEYGKIHKDFKSDDPKKPRTTKYVPGKGTVSMPVELTDELHPNVAKNDAINKANAMKRAKEREAKKPSADVIAARKRQYKGGSDYTTADKKKVIQSYKEEVTAKERMKRDAGAIAKKKMRNKEHRKYVNFLDVDESVAISEKIKYDKKGSSMDYFLGKDPKKTDEYKKSKKKNESSCECKHESFKDWLQEGNNTARMLHKSKTQVTGNVSADRGSDEKKNQASRKGLEKDLKKKGIGYKKGVGKYKYDSGETGTEVSYQTSKPDKMSKRRFGKTMRRLGRKHGQESVITKDKNKPARLHDTESKKPGKSINVGKSKGGSNPSGMGQTSGDKVRSGKLPSKSKKGAYHYG